MKAILYLSLLLTLCIAEQVDYVEVHEKIKDAKCIADLTDYGTIVRVFLSSGTVDPYAKENIVALYAQQEYVDIYINPSYKRGQPKQQVQEVLAVLPSNRTKEMIAYVRVEESNWDENVEKNRAFLKDMVDELDMADDIVTGIITKQRDWEKIVGADFSEFSGKKLMLVEPDKNEVCRTMKPFGGWSEPFTKEYQNDVSVCGNSLDFVSKCD